MKGIQLNIKGNWAHFRKVETNNNPLTHDFITKTAFIGLIGAVIGIERVEMRELYPKFCDGLLFSVAINNATIKESWSFTLRNIKTHDKSPSQFEILKNPNFDILVGLKDESLADYFQQFSRSIQLGKAVYTPVLGLHNCPAELYYQETGILSLKNGSFKTRGFVSKLHELDSKDVLTSIASRVGFDTIPTYQNNDFWNLPERFVQVSYPTEGNSLSVKGDYFDFITKDSTSQWYLI